MILSGTMRILLWNVHEFGNPWTFRDVCDVLSLNKLKVLLIVSCCFAINSGGRSGDLGLVWKEEVDVEIRSYSRYHVDSLVTWNSKTFPFSSIYGNPKAHHRHFTLELIRRLYNWDD